MNIEVTQDDIDKGLRCNGTECPVALALQRYVKDAALVTSAFVYFERKWQGSHPYFDTNKIAETPAVASRFILDFDQHKSVTPFSFNLDIPTEYLRNV